jgi:hypothetical protein
MGTKWLRLRWYRRWPLQRFARQTIVAAPAYPDGEILLMKNITLTLLAAAAIGAASIGSATAMPFNDVSAALGESHVQNVRVVCDQYQRCYNTGRAYRSARTEYAPRYYDSPTYYGGPTYYAAPSNGYYGNGYYGGPRVGIGIGPFGFGAW